MTSKAATRFGRRGRKRHLNLTTTTKIITITTTRTGTTRTTRTIITTMMARKPLFYCLWSRRDVLLGVMVYKVVTSYTTTRVRSF